MTVTMWWPLMSCAQDLSALSPLRHTLQHVLMVLADKSAPVDGAHTLDTLMQQTAASAGILCWPAHVGPAQAAKTSALTTAAQEWLHGLQASAELQYHDALTAACWNPAPGCGLTLCWQTPPDPLLLTALTTEQTILHTLCLLLAQKQDMAETQLATQRATRYQAILAESLEWLDYLEHRAQQHFDEQDIYVGLLKRMRIICNIDSVGMRLYRKNGEPFQWLHLGFPETDLNQALTWRPQADDTASPWEMPGNDGPISLLELSIRTPRGLRARLYLRAMRHTPSRPFSWHNTANAHQLATLAFKTLEKIEMREDLQLSNQFLAMEREDHTRLIAELRDTRQQLQHTDKLASLGQLAAGVAHEINNPISFLGSNLNALNTHFHSLQEIIARGEAIAAAHGSTALRPADEALAQSQEIHEILEESREGLERVRHIVQDLRNFSRSGDVTMQMTDLHQCLDSTLNMLRHEFRHKTELVKDYGDIPLVECAAGQINQVFMNLLVNAAQAIETQGRIAIHTGCVDDSIFVRIEDTGSGIPTKYLNRIFDPFFTTKPVGTGTGLGLSLSYGIIKHHHGRIEVDSTPGQGTCFTVWLPILQPEPLSPEEA